MFRLFGNRDRHTGLGIKRWARDKMDRLAGQVADIGAWIFIKFKF